MFMQSNFFRNALVFFIAVVGLTMLQSQASADYLQPTVKVVDKGGYARVTVRVNAKIGPLQINRKLGSFNVPKGQTVVKHINLGFGATAKITMKHMIQKMKVTTEISAQAHKNAVTVMRNI